MTPPIDPLGAGNTALLAALGVTPLGFWDVRKHLTVATDFLVLTGGFLRASADPAGAGAQLASSFATGVIVVAFAAITGAGIGSSIEVPNIAKATSGAPVGAEPAGDRFAAIASNPIGTANVAIKFRARLILPGLYSSAQRDLIKAWATTFHGAALQ